MPKPLLLARPSGLYARFLVPIDLRGAVGSRFLVRPLHEPAGDRARLVAACMGVALSQAFEAIRQGDAVDLKKALEAARAAGRRDLIIKGMTLRNGTHVAEAQLETLQDVEMLERLMGQVAEKDPLAAAVAGYPPQVPTSAAVPSGPLLSACIDKHLASLGKLAPKTIIESRHSLRILLGLVGDIPVATLDADHVQAFMDAVEHWPRNATKNKLYRDLSVPQVLALSKRKQRSRRPVRRSTSIGTDWGCLFRTCASSGFYSLTRWRASPHRRNGGEWRSRKRVARSRMTN